MANLLGLKRGKDSWYILPKDFKLIVFPNIDQDGKELKKLNHRTDFSDIPVFANLLMMDEEIQVPVSGYTKDGKIYITDGERRCRASMYAWENNKVVLEIPFQTEKRGTTVVDRLYKQIKLNNHRKSFNQLEEASVVTELISQGQSESVICEQLGYSKVHLSNLKLLQKAPDSIKNLIGDKGISGTLAMDILRETKGDYEIALQLIKDAMSNKSTSSNGESTKVTKKDIVKTQGKVNSYSIIRKAIKKAEKGKLVVRMDKIDEYTRYKDIVDGNITEANFLSDFFEPIPEKEKKGKKKNEEQGEMVLNN